MTGAVLIRISKCVVCATAIPDPATRRGPRRRYCEAHRPLRRKTNGLCRSCGAAGLPMGRWLCEECRAGRERVRLMRKTTARTTAVQAAREAAAATAC